MHLDQTTLLTLKDLVVLVKAKISEDIKATNLSENDKLVLVHGVLVVIQKALVS